MVARTASGTQFVFVGQTIGGTTVATTTTVNGGTPTTGGNVITTTVPAFAIVLPVSEVSVGSNISVTFAIYGVADVSPADITILGNAFPLTIPAYANVPAPQVLITYDEGWGFFI